MKTGNAEQNAPSAAAVVQEAYDRLFAGNLEGFLDCLAVDCVLHEPASLPYGGRFVGRDEITAAVVRIMGIWSEFAFDLEEMLTGEKSVIAYGQMNLRGKETGIAVTFPLAERWIVKDGKIAEIVAIYGDTNLAIKAAGGSAG